jgi:hypothetical protein
MPVDESVRLENFHLPDGLPSWLAAFINEALRETDTLRENGADQAASARMALLKKLVAAAAAWFNAELDTATAAEETGRCKETIRRAVRDGAIPDSRANRKDHIRVRRGDLQKLAAHQPGPYDPSADAQDIARLRRKV